MNKLKPAGISKVEIERASDKRTLTIHVSRPGVVIGRGGTGLEELKKMILAQIGLADPKKLDLKVEEVKKPDLDAVLVAQTAADQISRRFPPRRVANQVVERVMSAGAAGVRVTLKGRLRGAEIARSLTLKQGKLPLHTLRADIDFAKVDVQTKSGTIGVKVWICKP